MKSLWEERDAARYTGDLGLRVYSSRLLGRERTLVLHGGGNTSVKLREVNVLGEEEDILYVKGSGWDLETIEPAGFSPVRLQRLLRLARLERLSDTQMARELRSSMTDAGAPSPSVEALLHALLPYRFVDHTHADAVIALMNNPDGEARVREVYGDTVVVVPYVMPGFALARRCADLFSRHAGPHSIGMVLIHHGVFTFADSARASYEHMIDLVTRAEDYLIAHQAWHTPPQATAAMTRSAATVATLRQAISQAAGGPMVLSTWADQECADFITRDDLPQRTQQGPATPDHVIRTKRLPLLGTDVQAYVEAYRTYFAEHAAAVDTPLTMLDPAPRIVLDPQVGLGAAGRTARDAAIAGEIYRHTMRIIVQATALGGYRALPAHDIFDMEYWELEQAKLRGKGQTLPFTGEVALVTGAASGIGKACVEALLARGSAVVALDINPLVTTLFGRDDVLGVRCDVTDEGAVIKSMEAAVYAFGGLDMLILNAGIFPPSQRIENLTLDDWDRTMRINLDANLVLLRAAHPLLRLAPCGGRVALVGSKNVPAPGQGAAAYSASKAALTQLARVAALEWGAEGIRVNVLHPNAVFDTGIWTEDVLRARAASYHLSVEEYRRANVLRVEVTSADVAALAAELCGPLFSRTTGAQIPVDGGNERVI